MLDKQASQGLHRVEEAQAEGQELAVAGGQAAPAVPVASILRGKKIRYNQDKFS